MRLRPSADKRLFFLAGFAAAAAFLGLPGRFLGATAAPSPSNTRARCNRAISRSIDARISETPIFPPFILKRLKTSLELSREPREGLTPSLDKHIRFPFVCKMKKASFSPDSANRNQSETDKFDGQEAMDLIRRGRKYGHPRPVREQDASKLYHAGC
jgi:hypothetical protein